MNGINNRKKDENEKLKTEIDNSSKDQENKNPNNIKLLSNIINDSYAHWNTNNSFMVFKSIKDILYLIYANQEKSIICFDLNGQKKTNEIKNPHNQYISHFRHCLDKINKRDLIMSISAIDSCIKIWNVNNWECILNLPNIYDDEQMILSACFLNINNEILIITSNQNYGGGDPIWVFDLKGEKIKEFKNNPDESTYFIDTFYDNNLSNYYIVTGNQEISRSYNYLENKLYKKYREKKNYYDNMHLIIMNKDEIIKLIISCSDGIIRIFNFHSAILLNKFKISNEALCEICLWDENYLFVGCNDKIIKLVDINNGNIMQNLSGHDKPVITIKKIYHPKYGICLFSQGWQEFDLNIWI